LLIAKKLDAIAICGTAQGLLVLIGVQPNVVYPA